MNFKIAYLIVVCDKETNALKYATIWSSPEWEQSMFLNDPTYVAFQVSGETYDKARKNLITAIEHPRCRYHWLLEKLDRH